MTTQLQFLESLSDNSDRAPFQADNNRNWLNGWLFSLVWFPTFIDY